MDQEKLLKLLAETERLQGQAGSLKPKKVISLAEKCGWRLSPRGNHPIYENVLWEDCPFLTIPYHIRKFKKYTALGTLQQIEGVLLIQLEKLENPKPTKKEGEEDQ